MQRSHHCLLSDSDKFTIKLHSFPSKCPSSRSRLLHLSRFQPPACPVSVAFSASPAPRSRRSTLGTDDNHNSLHTRAAFSPFFSLLLTAFVLPVLRAYHLLSFPRGPRVTAPSSLPFFLLPAGPSLKNTCNHTDTKFFRYPQSVRLHETRRVLRL